MAIEMDFRDFVLVLQNFIGEAMAVQSKREEKYKRGGETLTSLSEIHDLLEPIKYDVPPVAVGEEAKKRMPPERAGNPLFLTKVRISTSGRIFELRQMTDEEAVQTISRRA